MSTHDQTPNEPDNELVHDPDQTDGTGSVEHYVRLQEYIEQLRADQRPSPSSQAMPLPAKDAPAYRMAAFLRAAAPNASEPDPAFVAQLQARIMGQFSQPDNHEVPTAPQPAPVQPKQVPQNTPAQEQPPLLLMDPRPRKRPIVSRRSLLGAGIGAAAAAIGVAAGVQIEHAFESPTSGPPPVALIPQGSGIWVPVASVESIPIGGVKRFDTDYVVGFVRHTETGFVALSGACTHMGCLLLWNASDRTFDCPCHGGRFNEQGQSSPGSSYTYRPLPPIQTKVESDQVWVYVIPPQEIQTTPTVPAGPNQRNYG